MNPGTIRFEFEDEFSDLSQGSREKLWYDLDDAFSKVVRGYISQDPRLQADGNKPDYYT